MNKLGKREYIKLIAETVTEVCEECGADIDIAEALLNKLTPYLYFHPQDMDCNEFRKWKKERKVLLPERCYPVHGCKCGREDCQVEEYIKKLEEENQRLKMVYETSTKD
jgi:hypothetical protein